MAEFRSAEGEARSGPAADGSGWIKLEYLSGALGARAERCVRRDTGFEFSFQGTPGQCGAPAGPGGHATT